MPNTSKNIARTSSAGDITLLLSDATNPESLPTVVRLVYDELHRMAAGHIHREPPGRSLEPTDLLNEACLRILRSKTTYKNRRHFFVAASEAMRRTLIERARRRHADKRGGTLRRVDLSEAEWTPFEQPGDLLDFNAALRCLTKLHPTWSEVAELRVFGGWSTGEVATILGCGQSTARRRWAMAREWLSAVLANSAQRPTTGVRKIRSAK